MKFSLDFIFPFSSFAFTIRATLVRLSHLLHVTMMNPWLRFEPQSARQTAYLSALRIAKVLQTASLTADTDCVMSSPHSQPHSQPGAKGETTQVIPTVDPHSGQQQTQRTYDKGRKMQYTTVAQGTPSTTTGNNGIEAASQPLPTSTSAQPKSGAAIAPSKRVSRQTQGTMMMMSAAATITCFSL